jgi:predicted DNA repair protein MutK
MFLVGGGILVHGIPPAAEALHHIEELAHGLPAAGGIAAMLANLLVNGLSGIVAGGVIVGIVNLARRLLPGKAATHGT